MEERIYLGLSDLLDQDLTSYEYFHSLPASIRHTLEQEDIRSFSEMQQIVARQKEK
ncbi:hypothetical protein [Zongyangia hominis]|uniref:Uncharacterized protein n=1 Tax=Zongyangia hominis TaxID=2763677 RepID=A0A926EAD2_9FIRM|nr:hypothetical protein [Zongyangia hominis]MBC8569350.1 hypothetical protein [Zongyangia hominis]